MQYTSISGLSLIEESEATGETKLIYSAVMREMGIPVVPNYIKALAPSPAAINIIWDFVSSFYRNVTLPQSLISMILYSIAERNHCKYCSAGNELTCRNLGVDEQTLSALAKDLGNVSPQRVKVIIEFALKINDDPQSLVAEDYERVRAEGVSTAELLEIILVAATGKFNDTLADSLKIDVDDLVAEALSR